MDFLFPPDTNTQNEPDQLEALFPHGVPEGPPPTPRPSPHPTTRSTVRRNQTHVASERVTLLVQVGKHPGKYTLAWKRGADLNYYLNQAGIYYEVVKGAYRVYDTGNLQVGKLRPRYQPQCGATLQVVGRDSSAIARREPALDKPKDQTIVAAVPIAGAHAGPRRVALPVKKPKGLLGFDQESI